MKLRTQRAQLLIPHTEAMTSQMSTYCFPSIIYLQPEGERVAPSRKRLQILKSLSKGPCQAGVAGNFLTVATLHRLQPLSPCLPCADCPLAQTPAACASPGTERVLSGSNMWYQFIFLGNGNKEPTDFKNKKGVG